MCNVIKLLIFITLSSSLVATAQDQEDSAEVTEQQGVNQESPVKVNTDETKPEVDGNGTENNEVEEVSEKVRTEEAVSEKSQVPKENFSPEINWDEPKIKPTNRPKVHKVTLLGKTEKDVNVRVGRNLLWIKADKSGRKKVKKIAVNKLKVKGKRIVSQKLDGSFAINILLPEGELQIPVGLIRGNERAKFQLVMFVKDKKIELKNQATRIKTDCQYCIWLGAGLTYLNYQQDPPQDIKDVKYGAFGLPSITFKTWIQLVKNWKLRFAYHRLTGPDLSANTPGTTLSNKSIQWQHMGLEVDYRALPSFKLLDLKFDPALLIGVQNQDMPFLLQTAPNFFSIESFKFNTASVGGLFFVNNHKRWYYEIFMRLQTAVSSSGDVQLSSGFAFDGSVGGIYRLGQSLRLGIFWGGQFHKYNYTINSAPGTYSLLSSAIDLALGYEF